jgi:hypothetical protein
LYVSETNVTAGSVDAFRKQHPAIMVSWTARPAARVPLNPGSKHER